MPADAPSPTPPKLNARYDRFDPYFSYPAQWCLFVFLPILALAFEILWVGRSSVGAWEFPGILSAGVGELSNRDFWVPMLWAIWMPWFNGPFGPLPGYKKIVFRDFNGNPTIPLAIPILHGVVWSACMQLPIHPIVATLLFVGTFSLYDILMLRYDLLQIHADPFISRIGVRGFLRSFMMFWWIYLGTGLAIIHHFGGDSAVAVIGSTVALIFPVQFYLYLDRRKPVSLDVKRVAIIGAGWSGTYAAKWLAQAGLEIRVFERSDHIGGLWKYEDRLAGGVAESTFASSSHHYMHASDFPMETVAFPSHEEIYDFINNYADHFGVRDHVTFNTDIQSVRKDGDVWEIRGVTDDVAFTDTFDAVVVAGGFNQEPQNFTERYAGFTGEILHSSRYKHVDSTGNHKRIVIVGLGESAADVAHECAQIRNAEVYLSGSTQWFAGRFISGGFAADTLMAPGVRTVIAPFLDFEHRGRKIVNEMVNLMWGSGGSGVAEWEPPSPWLHGFVTKSRSAVDDVHEGRLTAKSRITKCDGNTITFDDGSTVEADLIIDCTGFAPIFPYLPKNYPFSEQYRLVFNREDPTISFVGTARPILGSIPALAEMQSRWIATVYSGRVRLPHVEEQEMDRYFSHRAHERRFDTSKKRPNLVDHEFYAAAIARKIGIYVPWFKLLLTDPIGYRRMLLAPWTAFKFNLSGRDGRLAMERIRQYIPKGGAYYVFVSGYFMKMGLMVFALRLATLFLAIILLPPFISLTIGAGFVAQRLFRAHQAKAIRVE